MDFWTLLQMLSAGLCWAFTVTETRASSNNGIIDHWQYFLCCWPQSILCYEKYLMSFLGERLVIILWGIFPFYLLILLSCSGFIYLFNFIFYRIGIFYLIGYDTDIVSISDQHNMASTQREHFENVSYWSSLTSDECRLWYSTWEQHLRLNSKTQHSQHKWSMFRNHLQNSWISSGFGSTLKFFFCWLCPTFPPSFVKIGSLYSS